MVSLLEDVRVVDLTHVWFGPWCTLMLAELGAEVIKIEPPWGSLGRIPHIGPMYGGASATFHHLNLNKKDVSVNLKDPRGRKVFLDLIERSDVVVENFTPGTMERLGLDYKELKKVNNDIIYAALSGFGETGPYSGRPSFAVIAEAMAGFTRATGDNADPEGPPVNMAGYFGDLGPGTMAAMTIIAALRHRDRGGGGQKIDVAQLDCMMAYNTDVTTYLISEKTKPERREEMQKLREKSGRIRVGGIYKVGDGWIQVAGMRARGIDALKKRLEVEELDEEMVKSHISEMTREEAVEFFAELGLPVAPIYYPYEAIEDPQVKARDLFTQVDHPKLGRIKVMNFPVKLSETPGKVKSAAPTLGEHNRTVLTEILGYSIDEIEELEKDGILVKG